MELSNTKTHICTLLIILSFQLFPIVFNFPDLLTAGQFGHNLGAEPPQAQPDLPIPGQFGHDLEPKLPQKPEPGHLGQNPELEQPQTPKTGHLGQVPGQLGQNPEPKEPQEPEPGQILGKEKQEFLDAHNKARAHVGEPFFVWNETLASYALWWAKKRMFDCRMIHSYGPYGENIFWGGRNHWTAADAVKEWVKEHRFYNRRTNACLPGKLCGHYTQIVWRDSVHLGCARVRCLNGGVFIICSYYPPGNYIDENPFMPNGGND